MQRSMLNSPDPWVLLVLCKRCWLLSAAWVVSPLQGMAIDLENTVCRTHLINKALLEHCCAWCQSSLSVWPQVRRFIWSWGKDIGKTGVSPFLEHQELILGRHENMNATFISYNCSTFAWGGTGPQRCSLKSACVILVFAHFCHLTAFHTTQGPVNRAGKGLVVHWPLVHLLSSAQAVQKQPFMTHRQTTGPHSSKTLLRQHCACSLIIVFQLRYSSQRVFYKYWTRNSQIEGANNWSLR